MIDSGWTGSRYVNGDAWPQDFIESCSGTYGNGGVDNIAADSQNLAVFAGHGNVGLLAFSHKRDNVCSVDFSSDMRLGSMSGATAAVAMYLSCDALQVSSLPNEANWQWVRQQLGWTNTIGIGDDEPAWVFNATSQQCYPFFGCFAAYTNADAWLAVMDEGGRHPIAVSYATGETSCWYLHDTAKLKDNLFNYPRGSGPSCGAGQPGFYYCYETV
jgi:hypothetical protein